MTDGGAVRSRGVETIDDDGVDRGGGAGRMWPLFWVATHSDLGDCADPRLQVYCWLLAGLLSNSACGY